MKILAASLLLLVLSCSLTAQYIFQPHKGERPLLKLGEWSDQERAHKGDPCGEYFMYEMTPDPPEPADRSWPAKVITSKVPVTEEEYRTGTYPLNRLTPRLLVIQFDDEKRVPTAEWVFPSPKTVFRRTALDSNFQTGICREPLFKEFGNPAQSYRRRATTRL